MGLGDDGEEAPSYGQYQLQIYAKGIFAGMKPEITTDPNKLRAQAQKAMKPEAYNYIAGGAGEGATMDANRLAFRQWKIIPRMLRPTVPRDLKVKLFGETFGMNRLSPTIPSRSYEKTEDTSLTRYSNSRAPSTHRCTIGLPRGQGNRYCLRLRGAQRPVHHVHGFDLDL